MSRALSTKNQSNFNLETTESQITIFTYSEDYTKSFYAKMHDLADKIITDDEFADIYCLDNGRPSVPPARLTKVVMLEHYENLSDRKALENVRFNIKWKYALDVPLDYEGFDRSLLVYFRVRLLINKKEKMIFKKRHSSLPEKQIF